MHVSTFLAQVDIPSSLLGPFALLVGALIVVAVLWRVFQALFREYIDSLKKRAEDAEARARASDERLDRIATAFLKATGTSAPE